MDADDERDPLDRLADEVIDCRRRGQRPELARWLADYPDRAEEIHALVSALALVEEMKPDPDQTLDQQRGDESPPMVERLGDFRIFREIGRGGMGIVYEAEQLSLGRRVALKVLPGRTARSHQHVLRFLREARAAAQLHHTNIVPVFGVGTCGNVHYYAMQYIRGLGLDQVLDEVRRFRVPSEAGRRDAEPTRAGRSGASASELARALADEPNKEGPSPSTTSPLPPGVTDSDRRYARAIARIGLAVAEGLAYAHAQGVLHRDIKPSNLLLDMAGNAWISDFGLAKVVDDPDLTASGDLVGTLRYLAPERLRGRCDARSDIHGLGLTLYEMLALRAAYPIARREELLDAIARSRPQRLRSLAPGVPRDLETIVHKAIEPEPDHRYPDAARLAEDLRRFLDDRSIAARRIGATERLGRWARRHPALAGLGLTVLVLLVLTTLAAVKLEERRQAAVGATLHAKAAESAARRELYQALIARAQAHDRAFAAGRRFDALDALRQAAKLAPGAGPVEPVRDGTIAALSRFDIRPNHYQSVPHSPDVLVVGIAPEFTRAALGNEHGVIALVDLATNRTIRQLPAPAGKRPVLIRVGPEARTLAVKYDGPSGGELVIWDALREKRLLAVPDGVNETAFDLSRDGSLVAAADRNHEVVVYGTDDGRERQRFAIGAAVLSLAFSPDDSRIALGFDDPVHRVDIRTLATGSTFSVAVPSEAKSLAWRPDGRMVAAGLWTGPIALIPTRPGPILRTIPGHRSAVVGLAFDPTGERLASASWDGFLRVWETLSGKELVRDVSPDAGPILFSRDGTLLGPGREGASWWRWDVAVAQARHVLVDAYGEGRGTWGVAFHPALDLVASAGSKGVRLVTTGSPRGLAFLPVAGCGSARWVADGSALITTGKAGVLRWPLRADPQHPEVFDLGPPTPVDVSASPIAARMAATPDEVTSAYMLDWSRGRVAVVRGDRVEVVGAHRGAERLALSPDGRWLATGTWKGTGVHVIDLQGDEPLRVLDVEGSAEVAFDPHGRRLITGCGTRFQCWDVPSFAPSWTLDRPRVGSVPGAIAFGADGRLAAVARARDSVQLIDPATGRVLATLEDGDPVNISSLGFRPDGRRLVVTFNQERILIWDLDALGEGLHAMGLDWAGTAPIGPAPRPVQLIRPWLPGATPAGIPVP